MILDEFGYDVIALERGEQAAIDVDRSLGSSKVPGREMPGCRASSP